MTREPHAVIAGTGRAGTTFLVQFLAACGLETGLDELAWHPRARAGLERRVSDDEALPYVVKDPWLFAYCDQLDLEQLQIEALIVPTRDLMAVAESRVHQERLSIAADIRHIWPHEPSNPQVVGHTAGGVIYSLDVVDQARILGLGFHKLILWAVQNELPLFLLTFPRLVEDCDYLLRSLWPWLGERSSEEIARAAFAETASVDAIRIRPSRPPAAGPLPMERGEPDPSLLERAALLDTVQELQRELQELQQEVHRLRAVEAEQAAELEGRSAALSAADERELRARQQLKAYEQELDELNRRLAARERP
jgi:hypothetical protein